MSLFIDRKSIFKELRSFPIPQKKIIKDKTLSLTPHLFPESLSSLTSSRVPSVVGKVTPSAESLIQSATVLILQGKRQCTSVEIFAFDYFINRHKEQLNIPATIIPNTIFHQLAKCGDPLEFVDILVKYGVDFGVQDYLGDTPLMWAIANANNGMARHILRNLPPCQLASLNKQCFTEKNSALHLLVAKGYTDRSAEGIALPCSNFELLQGVVGFKCQRELNG